LDRIGLNTLAESIRMTDANGYMVAVLSLQNKAFLQSRLPRNASWEDHGKTAERVKSETTGGKTHGRPPEASPAPNTRKLGRRLMRQAGERQPRNLANVIIIEVGAAAHGEHRGNAFQKHRALLRRMAAANNIMVLSWVSVREGHS
jgi:hypothetical protein